MLTALPYDNRILVKPEEAAAKIGDYEVPQDAQKKPKRGTVVAVGPGKFASETGVLIPMRSKVGDTVLYSKFGGTEIELDGVDYVVLTEGEGDCLVRV